MAATSAATARARVAFQRFGLGAKPGGMAQLGTGSSNAYDALVAELDPSVPLINNSSLLNYAQAAAVGQSGDFTAAQNNYNVEWQARVVKAMQPRIGFAERLVLFWSNHFSVSIKKSEEVLGIAGEYERDVIRKNVFGKFTDMLLAVVQHPAMICYLDNEYSMGPQSQGGIWRKGSYNENLAREIMELHTVGLAANYTQTDVTNFAEVLTGWSFIEGWEADQGTDGGTQANRGQFIYESTWHQPGAQTIMGKTYPANGQNQAIAVLKDLAASPYTAQHIAYKLIKHFITDTPTTDLVTPVQAAFQTSGGDLKATALALINLPGAWTLPFTKFRTPYETSIAQLRAFGCPSIPAGETWTFTEPLSALNHLPFQRVTPDGYPDQTDWWLNPDAMRIREETALFFYDVYGGAYKGLNAAALANDLYADSISVASLAAINSFKDQRRAMATLFMTPEFLRR